MAPLTSSDILQQIRQQVPCRQKQVQQLAIYYNHYLPSPPILVVHGLEHAGKLEAVIGLLRAGKFDHACIKSRDCLSQRHLLSKIFAACIRQVGEIDNIERYDRVDSINSLFVNLERLFEGKDGTFVLVIDGIDKQKGTTYTLLPALARLADLVPNLSLILISSSSKAIALHRPGIPFVYFPPYTRAETITMIMQEPMPLPQDLPEDFPATPEPQLTSIYKSFITTVYDTLTAHTSSTSIRTFRETCKRLWPRFIWPMLSGQAPPNRNIYTNSVNAHTQWDFARLLSHNRTLFQREGEKALLSYLRTDPTDLWTFEQLLTKHKETQQPSQPTVSASEPKQETPLLKSFSTLLLVSSYLASHTPPKHDIILFSRLSSSSTNKRKYLSSALSKSRTGGGVRKTPTKRKTAASEIVGGPGPDETPSKRRKAAEESSEGLAGERTPKSTRLLLEKTSNIPRPFTLERVVAILRAIHPDGLPQAKGAADKVYGEMAELERLRLVVRCAGDGGARGGDDGILEEKWRVNVGREFVVGVGRYWGVGLEGWEID